MPNVNIELYTVLSDMKWKSNRISVNRDMTLNDSCQRANTEAV